MASIIDADHFRSRAAASRGRGGSGGGTVDDTLRRLGNVELLVAAIRSDVDVMKGAFPHLATKEDVKAVECSVNSLRAEMHALMHTLETRTLKWIVGTMITVAALAFSIAKFIS